MVEIPIKLASQVPLQPFPAAFTLVLLQRNYHHRRGLPSLNIENALPFLIVDILNNIEFSIAIRLEAQKGGMFNGEQLA